MSQNVNVGAWRRGCGGCLNDSTRGCNRNVQGGSEKQYSRPVVVGDEEKDQGRLTDRDRSENGNINPIHRDQLADGQLQSTPIIMVGSTGRRNHHVRMAECSSAEGLQRQRLAKIREATMRSLWGGNGWMDHNSHSQPREKPCRDRQPLGYNMRRA